MSYGLVFFFHLPSPAKQPSIRFQFDRSLMDFRVRIKKKSFRKFSANLFLYADTSVTR